MAPPMVWGDVRGKTTIHEDWRPDAVSKIVSKATLRPAKSSAASQTYFPSL